MGPYANYGYYDIYLGTMESAQFRLVFFYPTFLMIFIVFFEFMDNKAGTILRLKSRKEYTKFYLKNLFIVICYFMLVVILIMGIFANLMPKTGYTQQIYKGYDNVNPMFLLIVNVLKTFLSIISMGLLNFIISSKFNNQKVSIICGIIYMCIIEITKDFYSYAPVLNFINIGLYSIGLMYSIEREIIQTMVFYSFYIILLLFVSNIVMKKSNINVGLRK